MSYFEPITKKEFDRLNGKQKGYLDGYADAIKELDSALYNYKDDELCVTPDARYDEIVDYLFIICDEYTGDSNIKDVIVEKEFNSIN